MKAYNRIAAVCLLALGTFSGHALAAPPNMYFSFDSVLNYAPEDLDGRGHAFTIGFPVNDELTTGIYQESLTFTDTTTGTTMDGDITALNMEYAVLDNDFGTDTLAGNLGVNVGHFTDGATQSEMALDIYTKVGLVFAGNSGINLKLGYRHLDPEPDDLSDVFVNLGFTLGF